MTKLLFFSASLLVLVVAGTGTPEVAARSCPARVDARQEQAGKTLFLRCIACHEIKRGSSQRIGPSLGTIFDGKPLSAQGYDYSQAFRAAAPNWKDSKKLDAFLAKPSSVVPGTKMVFAGLTKPEDRKILIAYLKSEAAKTSCK